MRIFALIACLFLFCFSVRAVFAADISFSNSPQIIEGDQEFILDVSVSGAASDTTNYIRASFFREESPTSYFGYIQNKQEDWYNGQPSPIDPKKFLEILIDNTGSWSGQVRVKPDIKSTYFKGNGKYFLKIGRYTASATSISNWSLPVEVQIQGVDPTASPTFKISPTEKFLTSRVPSKATFVQKITSVPSTVNTKYPEEVDTETSEYNNSPATQSAHDQNILGISKEASQKKPIPTPSIQILGKSNSYALFLISGAVILIIGCGILLVSAYRKQRIEDL